METKGQYSHRIFRSKQDLELKAIKTQILKFREEQKRKEQQTIKMNSKVKWMEKINKNLELKLTRKQHQLKCIQQIKDIYQMKRRNKIQAQMKKKEQLRMLQSRTIKLKKMSQMKKEKAKHSLQIIKKQATNCVKKQLEILKSEQNMKLTYNNNINRYKVKAISEQKQRGNEYIKQFYKERTKNFLIRAHKSLKQDLSRSRNYDDQLKKLQQKFKELKKVGIRKKNSIIKLDETISEIKRESSLVSLRSPTNQNDDNIIFATFVNPENLKTQLPKNVFY